MPEKIHNHAAAYLNKSSRLSVKTSCTKIKQLVALVQFYYHLNSLKKNKIKNLTLNYNPLPLKPVNLRYWHKS